MRNRCCCFIRENVRQTLVCRYLPSAQSKRQTEVCRTKSFHRVVTAGAKRLAAQKTPDSHAGSADSSMAFNCFARIFGAGWNKTAGRRQPRRDYCFVKLQKRNQNKTHRLMWHRLQSVSCPPQPHRLKSVPLFQPRSSRATCSTILRNSRKRSSSFELSKDLLALMTQS